MDTQLDMIAKSYDRHFIEYGKKDSLSYDNLPDYITGNPEYPQWKAELENGIAGKEPIDMKQYLSPAKRMNFVSLGCSLNLTRKGYGKWPSTYYGVDISSETIQMLNRSVKENKLPIGSLHCTSIHETPFDDSFFDIGECIGVLEYYEKDFVLQAIREFHRILKPGGRFVLDVPNAGSPSGRVAMLIEECMGRPDHFNMSPQEFENLIQDYFEVEDSDRIRAQSHGYAHMGMMYLYCLRCKK
ncbi:MAG: class I SAM-dependent methyltransferase [Oscillospiraceae bacterium]|nr:class I SAM-dependent methyltransferase [Oscillospiraceae bacterium]